MAKILVIRKTDKTIHRAPLTAKVNLQALNNRLPANKKWKIEEMEESEAMKLPYIDDTYITAGEAQVKATKLQSENETLQQQNADLLARLEALEKAGNVGKVKEPTNAATKEQLKAKSGADGTGTAEAGDAVNNGPADNKAAEIPADVHNVIGDKTTTNPNTGTEMKAVPGAPKKAADLILEIDQATTVEAVDALVGEDKRATVLKAAAERKTEIELG